MNEIKDKKGAWIGEPLSEQEGGNATTLPPFQPKLVRNLCEFTDIVGYKDKVWFYRTMYKPTDKYRTKYLKDYYCYKCKGPFAVNEKISRQYEDDDSIPIASFYHKNYIDTKEVKDKWGYTETKNYAEGWCCHCWAIQKRDYIKGECGCKKINQERIEKFEAEIKDLKEHKRQLHLWANKLNAILVEADREKLKFLKMYAEESHQEQSRQLLKVEDFMKNQEKGKVELEKQLKEWETFIWLPQQNKPKPKKNRSFKVLDRADVVVGEEFAATKLKKDDGDN